MKWFYTIRLFLRSNRIFCCITCSFCNVYLRLLTLPNDPYFSAFSWLLIATSHSLYRLNPSLFK